MDKDIMPAEEIRLWNTRALADSLGGGLGPF